MLFVSNSHRPRVRGRREAGQILILFAVLLPVLLGFTGLVIDIGMMTVRRTDQQRATDSAVIAGAQKWLKDGTASRTSEAQAYATKNGYTTGSDNTTVAVTYPTSCGIKTTYGSGLCIKV